MKRCATAGLMAIFLLLGATVACHRNPEVRTQRYFASGVRYLEQGKSKEAALQLSTALQIDPKFTEAHYQLARAWTNLSRFNDAFRELSITCEQNPSHLNAQIDLASLLLAGNSLDGAEQHAQAALKLQPNSIEAHQVLANILMARGKTQEAMAEMQTAIDLDPNRARSHLNLALLYANRSQHEAAKAEIRRTLELDPNNLEATLVLAEYFRAENKWGEAESEYRRAIQLAPRNLSVRAGLSRVYLYEKRPDMAEQVFLDAKRDIPDDSEAWNSLGEYYRLRGDHDRALSEFTGLYKQHPSDLRTRNNYVESLLISGRFADAAKLVTEALQKNAKDPDLIMFNGRLQMHDGKLKEAVQSMHEALERAPERASGHYFLGTALRMTGDTLHADAEIREAARLDPGNINAQQALAEIAVRTGDRTLLSQAAEQLIKIAPELPSGYALRGALESAQKQFPAAEADFKKVLEVAPDDAESYLRFGMFRYSQKNYPDAERLFEETLRRNPNSVDALRGLVDIYDAKKIPARSIARIDEQITRAPQNPMFYQFKASLLMKKRDYKSAVATLQKALSVAGNNHLEAALMLAQAQVELDAVEDAISTLAMASKIDANDHRPYLMHAMLEDVRSGRM